MKKIITTIFLVFAVTVSFSQENTDAVFKNLVKEYTLNKDGSIDYNEIKEIELHSHYSFHRLYGESFIIYNTDYQELKINSAYTIMKDGKKTTTPANAFNQVLPRFSNNSPAYNHIREMVVTHTGLEVGATINLDYTLHSKPDYYHGLMGTELLFNSSPTESLTIIINIPESEELYYKLINSDAKPLIETEKGMKVFTWTFSNLPATSKDRYQPAFHQSEPQLQFSTLTFQEAYNAFVNQEAFNLMTDESMNKAVQDAVSKSNDKLSLVLELQKLVVNNLGNINVPMQYTGFKCRNTIDTWNSNQGTPLEKALLLKALLQKANITSDVVAALPSNFYGNTGDLSNLNNFSLRVDLKKHGKVFISSNKLNSQSLIYSLGGMTIIPMNKAGKLKPYFPKPSTGSIEVLFDISHTHSGDKKGEAIVEVENNDNPYYSLYKDSAYVKRLVRGASSIKEYDILKLGPEETEAVVHFKPTIKTNDLYNYLSLPYASNGVDSWNMTQLTSSRNAPLEIPELINEKYEYLISIPGDAYLVTEETFTIVDNEVGSIKLELQQKESKITYKRSISFKKKIVSIDEYDKFKKLMDLWNTAKYREIIYKRTKK